MRPFDFESSVGFWICTTAHMFRKRLDERLARQGVTGRQFEVLSVLAMHGEMAQKQLADHLGIEAPALGGLVSRMERDGWLIRKADDADRRRILIRPAEKAEAVWSDSVDYFHQLRKFVTRGLSAEQLFELRTMCDTIQANLKASDAELDQATESRDPALEDTVVDVSLQAFRNPGPSARSTTSAE